MTRALLGLCATIVLLLAVPSGATAKVTWSGIAGVKLGMSIDEAQAKLGRPTRVDEWQPPGTERHVYRARELVLIVHEDRVMGVRTKSRAHRAPRGVRVGMREREVRRRVRGETCGSARGYRVCSVARAGRAMDFVSRRGRLVEIAVSRFS
jgi:hypothetical protein